MKIEACRAFVEKLIWATENHLKGYGLDEPARVAKANSSEMVIQVTSEAMYLRGGYGSYERIPGGEVSPRRVHWSRG
jgi:alkylation response protein AidB-like acyl-CoA dehydrogenase